MDLSNAVLGHYHATQLQRRIATPVLQVGKDTFTRSQLAGVDCFNYLACAFLTAALAPLKVKDTADVFEHVSPEMLALPRVGVVSLAVLGRGVSSQGPRRRHAVDHVVQETFGEVGDVRVHQTRRTGRRGRRAETAAAADTHSAERRAPHARGTLHGARHRHLTSDRGDA